MSKLQAGASAPVFKNKKDPRPGESGWSGVSFCLPRKTAKLCRSSQQSWLLGSSSSRRLTPALRDGGRF